MNKTKIWIKKIRNKHLLKNRRVSKILFFILIILLLVNFFQKNKIFLTNLEFYIPWEAFIVIVTALAWQAQLKINTQQYELNKRRLEVDDLSRQEVLLKRFKEKELMDIARSFDMSMSYWFLYDFEEFLYKVSEAKVWSLEKYSYETLSVIRSLSLATNKYEYNSQKKNFTLKEEYEGVNSKKILPKDKVIVMVKNKFFQNLSSIILPKGNQNTTHFNKDGYLSSGGQSFPTFRLNEDKPSHLILKISHGGNNCLTILIWALTKIETSFKDKILRDEALKLLFKEDSYIEILEIIKKAFWFKSSFIRNPSLRSVREKKMIYLTFKKYKSLEFVDDNLREIDSIWRRLFGIGFFNGHPNIQ